MYVKSLFFAIFAVALSPITVGAAGYSASESGIAFVAGSVEKCFDFGSYHHTGMCVSHFHEESEARLAEMIDGIRARLDRDRVLFDEANRNWHAFRQSECKLRSAGAQAFRDPERQAALFFKACIAELNNERIGQLEGVSLGCAACPR